MKYQPGDIVRVKPREECKDNDWLYFATDMKWCCGREFVIIKYFEPIHKEQPGYYQLRDISAEPEFCGWSFLEEWLEPADEIECKPIEINELIEIFK